MAERPILPPRRDEIATGAGGIFTQRVIQYLEDVATLTNDTPDLVLDDILGFLGGLSNVNIVDAQNKALSEDTQDLFGFIMALQSHNNKLLAMLRESSDLLASTIEKTVIGDTLQGKTCAILSSQQVDINSIYSLIAATDRLIGVVDTHTKDIEDLKQLHGGQ